MIRSVEADLAAVAELDVVPAILDVVCRTTGLRFAAIARVTDSRWVACAVRDQIDLGLEPGGELELATTICDEIRQSHSPVVIDHVDADPKFRNHPTPARYGFQSYISFPIFRKSGEFFGTLCALDPRPARLNKPETIETFRLFVDLFAFHLEAQERLAVSNEALHQERRLADTRDQFIAVLGHDLRSPLAAIDSGLKLLRREPIEGKAASIVALMQGSVSRMAELIENVLDLAMGRLGGGIAVRADDLIDLTATCEQVVAELRTAWPGRRIEAKLDLAEPIRGDPRRLAQMLSNFVVNALTHGELPFTPKPQSGPPSFGSLWRTKASQYPPSRSVSFSNRSSAPQERRPQEKASDSGSTSARRSPALTGVRLKSARTRTKQRSRIGCRSNQPALKRDSCTSFGRAAGTLSLSVRCRWSLRVLVGRMKRSVLVVEDEAFVGLELVFIAESLGFQVTGPSCRSSAALEAAAYLPPHIALIDVNLLDGPTGPEIAAILNGTYGTIAIMVTANPEAISVGQGGVSAVVTKPFRAADVSSALNAAVELLPDTDGDTASESKAADAIGSEAA